MTICFPETAKQKQVFQNGPLTISAGVHEYSRDKISRDFVRNALQGYSADTQRLPSSALSGSEFSLDIRSESLMDGDLGSLSTTSSIQGVFF